MMGVYSGGEAMAVKELTVSPRLPADLREHVERTERVLERVLGPAADRVSVAWDVAGSSEPVVKLTITDHGISRTAENLPWEFDRPFRVRGRLSELWDGVLAGRLEEIRRGWDAAPTSAGV